MGEIKNLKDIEALKKIKIKDLKEYGEKYIAEDLEVGKKYNFNGKNSVHYTMYANIKKGFNELWEKFNASEVCKTLFFISSWDIRLNLDYKGISVWNEQFMRYDFAVKTRKNASLSNSSFILNSTPCIKVYTDDLEVSLYDYIIKLLDEQRNKYIGQYRSEIASLKRQIKDDEKFVKEYESIIL